MLNNKYKIQPIPTQDINIKISLSNDNVLSGLSQDVENLITKETGLSINPAADGEKFRYLPTSNSSFNFHFFSGNSYFTNLYAAGFNSSDIGLTNSILSSFYLLTLFDSTNRTSQLKLNNGFLNGFTFISESATTIYNISSSDEFSNLYIRNDFINTLTGETTLYFTLSFFNGKTGEVQLFFNNDLSGNTTEERNYFSLSLNPTGKSYTWDYLPMVAYEITNTGFTQSFNATVAKFENQKPLFPAGNAMDGNSYITL